MKLLVLLSFILLFLSCVERNDRSCPDLKYGKAVLVAYRVSGFSELWFVSTETKIVYHIDGIIGRRIPIIKPGDTINVRYCGSKIVFEPEDYVQRSADTELRFVSIKGYEYLY
jgi:hypothetical protein